MRCFFMKNGRICGVEYLQETADSSRIAEARELFETRGLPIGAEGFEVWDGTRFVYRFISEGIPDNCAVEDGLHGPTKGLARLLKRFWQKISLIETTEAPGYPFSGGSFDLSTGPRVFISGGL
jgi:hypothetical protein